MHSLQATDRWGLTGDLFQPAANRSLTNLNPAPRTYFLTSLHEPYHHSLECLILTA
jgi:hypothetical protein